MAHQQDDNDWVVGVVVIVAVLGAVMVVMAMLAGLLLAVLLFATACDVVAWAGLSFGVGLRRHRWTWIGPPTMPLTRAYLSVFELSSRSSRQPVSAPVDPSWPPPRMPLQVGGRRG